MHNPAHAAREQPRQRLAEAQETLGGWPAIMVSPSPGQEGIAHGAARSQCSREPSKPAIHASITRHTPET